MSTPEIEVIKSEALTIPEKAKLILVKDAETMAAANSFFLTIKGLRKKIGEALDPLIAANFQAHKVAVAKKKELEAPLVLAEGWLNSQISNYHQEQEKIRRAEENRLLKIALEEEAARRKKAEEEKLAQAALLEAAGAKDEADQLVSEAIQETEAPVIIEQPKATTPKVEMNGMAMVTNWKFRVTNDNLIPRQYLSVDESKIGAIVRSQKENTNIPGIQVYPETKARSTGR